ncbi:hypothetical protein A3740_18875 [Oleiphilus sp. HI0068]|nr:hypothetical protein A3740_18875 [Oleiphilus sp. HI0068]KZY81208.1 hypothetical protein A3741_17605 [Oleiphilus sp. HI0069]KZZ31774.1 hypothetical protein A3755_11110 [Oleiphilus sp. HI0085]
MTIGRLIVLYFEKTEKRKNGIYKMLRCTTLVLLLLSTISCLASDSNGLKGKHLHLEYIDYFKYPLADLVQPSSESILFKPLFELAGPVKEVSLFQDKEKKIHGSPFPYLSLPWYEHYMEFDGKGNLVSVGANSTYWGDAFWKVTRYEYNNDYLPVKRTTYGRKGEVISYYESKYSSQDFLLSRKYFSQTEKDAKVELQSIHKFQYKALGSQCWELSQSVYKVKTGKLIEDYLDYLGPQQRMICKQVNLNEGTGYMPVLRRMDENIYYGGTNLDVVIRLDRDSRRHFWYNESGHLIATRKYMSQKALENDTYEQIDYSNTLVDSFGNWLEREVVTTNFALGEKLNERTVKLYRTIKYHH